ncbi:molybdopterin-dependent oxidoreductase [Alkaliphilus peptidifermentans]|uniref:Oxidoreductase molybdopterin binding domain-containing protein n=1 Tax=Alkaliphilus peptidifermentans DSM 18978 TaxID=1120976 RepID=A0A1G5GLJ7_9FIRM|nr:molybdopterin-dependent oxidoreductase [Alkaliphilus peptidifermentans]SCY52209.1 Oxidoreductase molybdopterin binding domain-containing protein [Alkaliphilus peptidifermentans DSM 18978]
MKKLSTLICIAIILGLLLTGCTDVSTPTDGDSNGAEAAGNEIIIIAGLGAEDIEITVKKLKGYNKVTKEVVSVNSSGNENQFKATGCLLEDVLKDLGHSQKSLEAIRLVAGDGYSMEVPKEVVNARDIILAYEIDGEPLDEKSQPIRVIVPEERAMYWVRNLSAIEVLEAIEKSTVESVVFLEAATTLIPQEEYTYYDSVDYAVKAKDLIEEFAGNEDADVYIKAADGLEKNETLTIFKDGYIKITGEDNPMFLSPDIPKGMYVKNILHFSQGKYGFCSLISGESVFQAVAVEDQEGISIKVIADEMRLKEGSIYIFTAIDGYSVEVEAADLEKGIVYIGKEGELRTLFDGLPKNTRIKGLLSIEAME